MKLVSNWRYAHKMLSVQISLLLAALEGVWLGLPAFQEVMPPFRFIALCIGVSLAVCLVRIIKQKNVNADQ